MPENEKFECGKCGRSFDSERGLSIHQTQAHSGDDGSEKADRSDSAEQNNPAEGNTESSSTFDTIKSNQKVSVGVQHVLIGVFVLGLAVGFSGGMMATGTDIPVPDTTGDQVSGESTMAALKDIAETVGADGERVEQCVESSNGQEISEDKREIIQAVGRIGTPTFFIGNSQIGYTEVTGAQPYPRMKPVIDRKIQQAGQVNTSLGADEYRLENISFEAEPTMGEDSAPVNIIEYSDYGCPWCAEWHGADAIPQRAIDREESFSKVRSNYVETGKVRFVLKDYPVSRIHPDAETAHKAANCVLENSPDSFWEFSQKLYQERDRWKSQN